VLEYVVRGLELCVAQAGLEFKVPPALLSQFWDYKRVSLCLAVSL
jgi:hypothetical protein